MRYAFHRKVNITIEALWWYPWLSDIWSKWIIYSLSWPFDWAIDYGHGRSVWFITQMQATVKPLSHINGIVETWHRMSWEGCLVHRLVVPGLWHARYNIARSLSRWTLSWSTRGDCTRVIKWHTRCKPAWSLLRRTSGLSSHSDDDPAAWSLLRRSGALETVLWSS